MKLIIGLGNPGEKYANTRHNVGWLVLDNLKRAISESKFLISHAKRDPALQGNQIQNTDFKIEKKFNAEILRIGDVLLAKPQTFMNESGMAVASLYTFYKIQNTDLYVIHDDLDIALGEYKIQFGVGPKLHYGVQSIEEKLGTNDFWRVRIGIDNRKVSQEEKAPRVPRGEDYVLQNFNEDELGVLNETIEKVVVEMLKSLSL